MLEFEFPEPTAVDKRDLGYVCKHCGSYCKRYTRKFNSNMAICLLALVKHGVTEFVYLEDWMIKHGYKRCGDASYLVHYRFLEKLKGQRTDGSNRMGLYRITPMGIMFAEQKIAAKEKFIIYNNRCEGFTGNDVDIKQVLGTKFDYATLMQESPL